MACRWLTTATTVIGTGGIDAETGIFGVLTAFLKKNVRAERENEIYRKSAENDGRFK